MPQAIRCETTRSFTSMKTWFRFRPQLILGVENIRAYEQAFQPSVVSEQILGDVEEAWLKINRGTVTRGSSIVRELAEVLGEAASQVHQAGVLDEAREDI